MDKTPTPQAKPGDYVQWTSNGQEQFKPLRRVNWVADDGTHIRALGSNTGIPMAEVTVVEAPKAADQPESAAGSASVRRCRDAR
jgi:hypothetical protein